MAQIGLKKFLTFLGVTVLIWITSILLYSAIAFSLMFFPKKNAMITQEKTATLYLYHNTMHSDIILDLRTTQQEWKSILPEIIKQHTRGYLAFGWGDRETYLSTPQWGDIPASTALKALFINTPSLIHAAYYPAIRLHDIDLKTIKLTSDQYRALEISLRHAFGAEARYIARGYTPNDAFYHSTETYNFLHTCNTWTGDRLREANITMSYWTPFSYNVVYSLAQ